MTFVRGLLAGRSHLAFIVGLSGAVLTVRAVDRLSQPPAPRGPLSPAGVSAADLPLRPPAQTLSRRERALAHAAWSYLERNTDPVTGLAPSAVGGHATTMWDVGSQLLALLAAEDLGLVSSGQAVRRLERAAGSLAAMPLFDGRLPNKSYDTHTLEMVDYAGQPAPDGIGWSALDVARVLVPLAAIPWRHPELTPLVRRVTGRWRLDALADGKSLVGASRDRDGRITTHAEGRLGYEQLAAKALLPWGVPVAPLLDYRTHLAFTDVLGVQVPHDDRTPRDHGGTQAAALSEPWVLDALENGFDAASLPLSRALLQAQRRRYLATGVLTAVSEDALDRPPWFAYSAVLNGRDRWTAVDPAGRPIPGAFGFSAKAAVGWGVLFEGDYPDRLLDAVEPLVAPGRGIYAGRYDATGQVNRALSLDTNAVVLEVLAYRVRGTRLRRGPDLAPAEALR